jgi:hypothetical protein
MMAEARVRSMPAHPRRRESERERDIQPDDSSVMIFLCARSCTRSQYWSSRPSARRYPSGGSCESPEAGRTVEVIEARTPWKRNSTGTEGKGRRGELGQGEKEAADAGRQPCTFGPRSLTVQDHQPTNVLQTHDEMLPLLFSNEDGTSWSAAGTGGTPVPATHRAA